MDLITMLYSLLIPDIDGDIIYVNGERMYIDINGIKPL